MNTRSTRKRPFQQDTSELPPPAKRPRRAGGVESESIQVQLLRLFPEDLQHQYEVIQLLHEASKTRLAAGARWYKDGGYEEELQYLVESERELDILQMGIKTREGFQKGKDKIAELDREEKKMRVEREKIRREFEDLAVQARSLDIPFLVKLAGGFCGGNIGVEPATDKGEEEVVVAVKE
ncbi:hypothetical protein F25303_12996 [Fusarium sp. NRRL 25303]|nr:hypothetical protein F25303_12996 [Fusarium sp. NRRL 25303]